MTRICVIVLVAVAGLVQVDPAEAQKRPNKPPLPRTVHSYMERMAAIEESPDNRRLLSMSRRFFTGLGRADQVLALSRLALEAEPTSARREIDFFLDLLPVDRDAAWAYKDCGYDIDWKGPVRKGSKLAGPIKGWLLEKIVRHSTHPIDQLMARLTLAGVRPRQFAKTVSAEALALNRPHLALSVLEAARRHEVERFRNTESSHLAEDYLAIAQRASAAKAWGLADLAVARAQAGIDAALALDMSTPWRAAWPLRIWFSAGVRSHCQFVFCGAQPCSVETVEWMFGEPGTAWRSGEPIPVRRGVRALSADEISEMLPLLDVLAEQKNGTFFYVDSMSGIERETVFVSLRSPSGERNGISIKVHPRMNPKPPPEILELVEFYREVANAEFERLDW